MLSHPHSAKRALAAIAASLLGLLGTAQGSTINYGDVVGTDYVYHQVTESSATDALPLFGAPIVSGNALIFSPNNFASSSSHGSFDITDGTLETTIQSSDLNVIDRIRFSESGDYTLAGSGTTATTAQVSAALHVTVFQTGAGPILLGPIPVSFTFSPSGGSYNLINNPGVTVTWTGGVDVSVTQLLRDNGYQGFATNVAISLDNTLVTFSEAGSISFIEKKAFNGVTLQVMNGGNPIPEPASLALLGFAAVPLLARRRR